MTGDLGDEFEEEMYVVNGGDEPIAVGHNADGPDEVARIVPKKKRQYEPHFVEMARIMFGEGWTDEEFAEKTGVHRSTLYRWRAQHPEFAAACALGKETADDRVEKALYTRCVGYDRRTEKLFAHEGNISRGETIEHIPPETKAIQYWLNNRRNGKWKTSSELTGKNGAPLVPADGPVSDKELARFLALIISQGAKASDEGEDNGS